MRQIAELRCMDTRVVAGSVAMPMRVEADLLLNVLVCVVVAAVMQVRGPGGLSELWESRGDKRVVVVRKLTVLVCVSMRVGSPVTVAMTVEVFSAHDVLILRPVARTNRRETSCHAPRPFFSL
jgi:hypothetical protein